MEKVARGHQVHGGRIRVLFGRAEVETSKWRSHTSIWMSLELKGEDMKAYEQTDKAGGPGQGPRTRGQATSTFRG